MNRPFIYILRMREPICACALYAKMSLFKAREWWATVSGFEEFHDLGCLAVGNLDNTPISLGKKISKCLTAAKQMKPHFWFSLNAFLTLASCFNQCLVYNNINPRINLLL